MFTKAECRLKFKAMRDQLSADGYEHGNRLLLERLKEIPLDGVAYIHLFLPIQEQREPNTFLLIDYISKTYPAITLVVPRSDLKDNLLTHHVFSPNQEMIRNKWGIIEPHKGSETINEDRIDLVFLPLLAFDKEGNRVGYGRGYYDRFLGLCKPNVQKIGLSFFDPVERITDIGPHDIPLDKCITPSKVWVF